MVLPKPEKNQKKLNAQQLTLTDITQNGQKIQRKRRLLYLSLFLTIGLSFIFWIFRYFSHPFPSFLNIKPISRSIPVSSKLEKDVISLISQKNSSVSVYVFYQKSSQTPLIWTNNQPLFQNINPVETEKEIINSDQLSSLLSSSLPSGAVVKELIKDSPGEIIFSVHITIPGQKILIVVNIKGSAPDSFKPQLPRLIQTIYWDLIQP